MNNPIFPEIIQRGYIDVSIPFKLHNVKNKYVLGKDCPLGEGILIFNTLITYEFISAKNDLENQTTVIIKSNEPGKVDSGERMFKVVGKDVYERAEDLCSQIRKTHGAECMISTRMIVF